MIKTSRLLQMARKWKQAAALGRKRISMAGRFQNTSQNIDNCSKNKGGKNKGSFVVYSTDKRRFVVPLKCLNSPVMMELFRMCEDEFGAESNAPLTFPCDGVIMEYILSMIEKQLSQEMEKALLFFLSHHHCSSSFSVNHASFYHIPVCSC